MRPRVLGLVAISAFAVCLAGVAACGGPSVLFTQSGAVYTTSQARLVLEDTEILRLAEKPTSEAATLRRKALAQLRSQGASAAAAADLITDTFPPGTRSVPVYVEEAVVEGVPCYLVVEAWGPVKGKLDRKRLWVVDSKTADIVFSAAAR